MDILLLFGSVFILALGGIVFLFMAFDYDLAWIGFLLCLIGICAVIYIGSKIEEKEFTPDYTTEKFSIVSRVYHKHNAEKDETSILLKDGNSFFVGEITPVATSKKLVHMVETGDTLFYCTCQNQSKIISGVRPVLK